MVARRAEEAKGRVRPDAETRRAVTLPRRMDQADCSAMEVLPEGSRGLDTPPLPPGRIKGYSAGVRPSWRGGRRNARGIAAGGPIPGLASPGAGGADHILWKAFAR